MDLIAARTEGQCRLGGFGGSRHARGLLLLEPLAGGFVKSPTIHLRVEHFQGAAAGVDLVIMGEFGEAFEDAEQILVPRTAQDLYIARPAL